MRMQRTNSGESDASPRMRRSAWLKFVNGVMRGSLAARMDESSLPYARPFLTPLWPAREAGSSALSEAVRGANVGVLPGVGTTMCFSHSWDSVYLSPKAREYYKTASQRRSVLDTAYTLLAPVAANMSSALAIFPVLPLRVYVALRADTPIPIRPEAHFTDHATCLLLHDVWLYNELAAQIIYAHARRMLK